MRFSEILIKQEIDDFKNAVESWNLLMIGLYHNSKDIKHFYSTIETKLGYKWDGDKWTGRLDN